MNFPLFNVKFFRVICLLFLLNFLSIAEDAKNQWTEPNSHARILVLTPLKMSHILHVSLDNIGISFKGLKVLDNQGKTLEYKTYKNSNGIRAIDIKIYVELARRFYFGRKTRAEKYPVHIYFFNKKIENPTSTKTSIKSVFLQSKIIKLRARPEKTEDLLRMKFLGRRFGRGVFQESFVIPKNLNRQIKRVADMEVVQLTSSFSLEKDSSVALYGSSDSSAWYTFIDKKSHSGWCDNLDKDSQFKQKLTNTPKFLNLKKGDHTLDFFMIRMKNEVFPHLKSQIKQGDTTPGLEFHSPILAKGFLVEHKNSNITSGVYIDKSYFLRINGYDKSIIAVKLQQPQVGIKTMRPVYNGKNTIEFTASKAILTKETMTFPAITLKNLHGLNYKIRNNNWPNWQNYTVDFTIHNLSAILKQNEPFFLNYSATTSIPSYYFYSSNLKVYLNFFDENSKLLGTHSLKKGKNLEFNSPLPKKCDYIRLYFSLNNIQLIEPKTIKILNSGSDFTNLRSENSRFYLKNDFATIVLDETLTMPMTSKQKKENIKVILFDDMLTGNGTASYISEIKKNFKQDKISFEYLSAVRAKNSYDMQDQDKWYMLEVLKKYKNKYILLNIGEGFFNSFNSQQRILRELEFFVTVLKKNSCIPILFTLIPRENNGTIKTSINIKRLALKMNLPVCDLYSYAIKEMAENPKSKEMFKKPNKIQERNKWFMKKLTEWIQKKLL